jgi:PAS domain S-box-containing protein
MRPLKKPASVILILLLCGIASIHNADGQQMQRPRAVSAYIYNFAKNVLWQDEDRIKEFNFVIIGRDNDLLSEVQAMAGSRTLRGKPIHVMATESMDNISDAHLVFVTKEQEGVIPGVYDRIDGKNVLLVTDRAKDTRLIMINLVDSEKGTLRFEINRANILNQHLRIMDDMVLLGGTEIDVAALYRKGQQSLRGLQKRIESLEGDIGKLDHALKEKGVELQMQRDSLNTQTALVREQQTILDRQSAELKKQEATLAFQKKEIFDQKRIFDSRSQELAGQKSEIERGHQILIEQNSRIAVQEKILEEKGVTISKQKNILSLLAIIIILSVLLAVTVLYGYIGKKRLTKELEIKVEERTEELRGANEKLTLELAEKRKVEAALKESEIHYRYLFERSPVPMFVFALDRLRLLAVNKAFESQYGYIKSEALALRLTDLYPEADRKTVTDLNSKIQDKEHSGEWRHLKKNGTAIYVHSHSLGITYEGQPARIAVVTDITARKEAEEAMMENMLKFRTLFDTNPEAIFITELTTLKIFDCNTAACRMNGYARDELIGQSINMLYPDEIDRIADDHEGKNAFVSYLQVNRSVTRESTHRRKDGTLVPVETTMCLLELVGKSFVMGIDRDMTDRKRAEEQLMKYHEHLEDMVRDRTAQLEIAKERAESADRLKSAFLATMSHELRTPLNSIIGFTGILLKGIAGPLNDEQCKQLGMAKGSALHLLDLINDVLDISKIEAGQLVVSVAPFDLVKVLNKVTSSVQPLIAKKNLSLQLHCIEESISIESDERRIGQVILNLINNAIKFTDAGGICVECEHEDEHVIIKVIDSGIGIDPKDMDKLFKPFSQIDTGLSRNHEGTGLGLSICQRLIDKLGGAISVESEVGKGSTFTIVLGTKPPVLNE